MYQTQKISEKYYHTIEEPQFSVYGEASSNLSIEREGYNKMAISSSISHANSSSCVVHFGQTSSLLQILPERHHSFIIGQKDREIAYLKETVMEMKRRISSLERNRDTSSIILREVTIQDKPLNEIYQLVLDYYNSHPSAYPDEVADALSLDLRKVIEVVDRLIAEDKIEVVT
ncbi:MAG: hypothetical protein PHF57_10560 [Methanoregula sp.]|jgi:hypothetical protein|nr:hypothetical protein [Methanoregula sp.]MDD5188634.1 hypothetical protein [Methanoregula sp.]